ncbi:MAG: HNH endonuclease [Methylocystis sp.]
MLYIDEVTGERTQLFPTKEIEEDLKAHSSKFECKHEHAEVRLRLVRGGARQVFNQCTTCGETLGSAIKKTAVPVELPAFDESLLDKFMEEKNADFRRIAKKHYLLQKKREASNQKEYDAYLRTKKWTEKRRKVIERAGGLCEGCRERPPEDVHHLSYDHICDEFLFELVALCRPCHEKIHGKTAELEPPCCGCRWSCDFITCDKFQMPVTSAMAEDGPCGPQQRELEPLK